MRKRNGFNEFLSVLWLESKYNDPNGPHKTYESFCTSREYLEFHALATSLANRARTCKQLARTALNDGLTEAQEKRDQSNDAAMMDLAGKLGVYLEIQGDPRGYTVKLRTPKSKMYNTMAGVDGGWGVPGSQGHED
jgi:hypothetical protein